MGVRIVLSHNEPIEQAIKRFRKVVEEAGVVWHQRRQNYFVPRTQVRRAKAFQKRFKARRATLHAKLTGEQPCSLNVTTLMNQFWTRTGKP